MFYLEAQRALCRVDFFSHSFPPQKFLIADNFKGIKTLKIGFHQISRNRELDGETAPKSTEEPPWPPGQQKKGRKREGGMVKSGFYQTLCTPNTCLLLWEFLHPSPCSQNPGAESEEGD